MKTLEKIVAYEKFDTFDEMQVLLEEMSKTDQWLSLNMAKLKVGYIKAGTTPEYIYKGATNEQVDAAYQNGTMTLKVGREHYLMNPTADRKSVV